jgi:hypothetical protein
MHTEQPRGRDRNSSAGNGPLDTRPARARYWRCVTNGDRSAVARRAISAAMRGDRCMKESLAVRAVLADLGVHRIACVTSAHGCYGGDREAGAGRSWSGAGRGGRRAKPETAAPARCGPAALPGGTATWSYPAWRAGGFRQLLSPGSRNLPAHRPLDRLGSRHLPALARRRLRPALGSVPGLRRAPAGAECHFRCGCGVRRAAVSMPASQCP